MTTVEPGVIETLDSIERTWKKGCSIGDLPFIGRLFRSHAEKTKKRNLLVFVTGRLITPSGRELKVNELTAQEAEVKAAPKAE